MRRAALDRLGRCAAATAYVWQCLVILLLLAYYGANASTRGQGQGQGGLYDKLHCCVGFHVALGFVSWLFPPFFAFCIVYQVLDHLGSGKYASAWL